MENALEHFRQSLQETPDFADSLSFIESHFDFTPTAFTNHTLVNQAEDNQRACQLIALAKYAGLSRQETLLAFGEHYRHVRDDPQGTSHANIRMLMEHGLDNVVFERFPLKRKEKDG